MRSAVVSLGWLSAALFRTAASQPTTPNFSPKAFRPEDVIIRDVAVVGAGAAGTYAAIGLKDAGKSIIVIEKKDRIGGHTETWIDPFNGTPIDMGVLIWHNISVVTDFFKRFDIPLAQSEGFFRGSSLTYDFQTGQQVNVTFQPTSAELVDAFQKYLAVLANYPWLNDGLYVPDPVPPELYEPFGDFVTKYGIQAAVPIMYDYNPSNGDILNDPVFSQMRYWGEDIVHSTLYGFLETERHNASQLYTRAQNELLEADSLLLSSTVQYSIRHDGPQGVQLIVNSPDGDKLIIAKKLVVAIPPKLDIVGTLDLCQKEKNIFSKYIDAGYYVGILNNTGLPANTDITNVAPNTSYNWPMLPGPYSFASAVVEGLYMVTYSVPQTKLSFPMNDTEVQSNILAAIKTLQTTNPDVFHQTDPSFVDFASHAPYSLQVSAEDIKDGFYGQLYSLQGERNTWWTGAAWKAEDSSEIWKYTETQVLPKLLAEL